MTPFISVIIPNYNHVEFLPKRLESVFNQSFQNFEVILLDDFSSDDSWNYLKKFSDHPKVSHCIRNEVNSGSPFKQWKKGIDLAKYEWIWIAESDDFSELSFLDDLVSKIESNISLIYCSSIFVNENDQFVESKFPNWDKYDYKYSHWNFNYINSGLGEISEFLTYKNTIVNASSVLFKKPKYFPSSLLSMKYCGDWYFWIFLLQFGDISFVSKDLNYFRRHSNSASVNSNIENELIRVKEISNCIRFSKHVLNVSFPRNNDFVYYSSLVKYYAWNFNKLNLPVTFLLHLPPFISIQIIYQFFKHILKKNLFPILI